MGSLRGFVLLLLVLWIITRPAAGQNISSCGNCTVTEVDTFLNDKELKVGLLARHALFLQLAAESTDCGKYSLYYFLDSCSFREFCVSVTRATQVEQDDGIVSKLEFFFLLCS